MGIGGPVLVGIFGHVMGRWGIVGALGVGCGIVEDEDMIKLGIVLLDKFHCVSCLFLHILPREVPLVLDVNSLADD